MQEDSEFNCFLNSPDAAEFYFSFLMNNTLDIDFCFDLNFYQRIYTFALVVNIMQLTSLTIMSNNYMC